MKVAALLSGGKDSLYAIHVVRQWGWEVEYAVVVQPRRLSWMFHTDNIHLATIIADAMAIPSVACVTEADPEVEVNDLQEALTPLHIDGVISGAVASEYQRTRIEHVCHTLDIKSFTPLWHKDPSQLLYDTIQEGFSIAVVAVAAEGLGETWLGRTLDMEALAELNRLHEQYRIHVGGEGGEYETLVLDCPLYQKSLQIIQAESKWDGSRGSLHVAQVRALSKNTQSTKSVV
jgi:ABC transporter with metal-binding/Fe-S-binding domain ATP-binding protein